MRHLKISHPLAFESLSFSTDVSELPLLRVLEWMHDEQRTGMIRIGEGLKAGVLLFMHGHLFRAEWGTLTGEAVVDALLSLRRARMMVLQREIPSARPNVRTATSLLLDNLRQRVRRQGVA
jgi:hypothetical protein